MDVTGATFTVRTTFADFRDALGRLSRRLPESPEPFVQRARLDRRAHGFAVGDGFLDGGARGSPPRPTALVHEAYLRIVEAGDSGWDSRQHFFGAAARAMRRILVDQARARRAEKRGADKRVDVEDLDAVVPQFEPPPGDLVAIDEAVERLEQNDARKGQIVNLRYFAGLTIEETAEVLGISPTTAKAGWRMARAWLRRRLEG